MFRKIRLEQPPTNDYGSCVYYDTDYKHPFSLKIKEHYSFVLTKCDTLFSFYKENGFKIPFNMAMFFKNEKLNVAYWLSRGGVAEYSHHFPCIQRKYELLTKLHSKGN